MDDKPCRGGDEDKTGPMSEARSSFLFVFSSSSVQSLSSLASKTTDDSTIRHVVSIDLSPHTNEVFYLSPLRYDPGGVTSYPFFPVKDPIHFTGSVVRQTGFDVSIGPCVVSDGNLACAILIKHTQLSDGDVKVCLLP